MHHYSPMFQVQIQVILLTFFKNNIIQTIGSFFSFYFNYDWRYFVMKAEVCIQILINIDNSLTIRNKYRVYDLFSLN